MNKRSIHIVLHALGALLILAFYLFPLYWLFVNSIKSNIEIFSNPPTLWPRTPYFQNYAAVFTDSSIDVLRAFGSSLQCALFTALCTMIVALPAAYGLAKFRIRFCRLFLMIFIIGQMLSPTVKLVPLFIMFRDMKLINTMPAVIIALMTFTVPFAVLILRPFYASIPAAISESALIDGCNKFTAFSRVMLPISYPGIVVAAVFNFLSGWNDLVYPMTFFTDAQKRPLIANMYTYISEYGTMWNMLMTFAVISVLPVIALFFAMQKHIVGGITMGAVKG